MAQAQQALGGDSGGADASKASRENLNVQQVQGLLSKALGGAQQQQGAPEDSLQDSD